MQPLAPEGRGWRKLIATAAGIAACECRLDARSAPGWHDGGSALPSVRRMLKTRDAWS